MLAIVAQDVQRLDRLITDIARASRIEAETAKLDLQRVVFSKGAVHYIDRALAGALSSSREAYRRGLSALERA